MPAPDPGIFREYDIRGIAGQTLHEADAAAIGHAFARRAADRCGHPPRICVCYDGRLSSPPLQQALCAGLTQGGADVLHIGRGPTPMLYFAVHHLQADGGVMVTGSHNPPDHNGFKFMLGAHPFYGDDIRALAQAIAAKKPASPPAPGNIHAHDVSAAYLAALLAAYDGGGRKLSIAWDAGNGAAGDIVSALAARLPGTHIALNTAIDGNFPAHHPDPTEPENLAQLIAAVRRERCDAGIAFDGDGDRIGVVDDEGEILWGDQLLLLYAERLLAAHPGATVIADVKASQTLFDGVRALGGQPLMWKTGHSHIKAKMKEAAAKLAGEMSGHIFFADSYYGFDDGLYAAMRLLAALSRMDRPLSAWRKALKPVFNTPELRFPCPDARKFAVIEEVRAALAAEGAEFSDVDGVRVRLPEGWWLLRASNTQAMLVARAEAADAAGLRRVLNGLTQALQARGLKLPDYSPAASA
ncbi:MAG: phosphomannomutase/phosphoglucomutase [Alphaproteobacteria bacterium]|nr:phosphomannomutase/phosphoglucomutase [Alphaproteobacteria bacterium]